MEPSGNTLYSNRKQCTYIPNTYIIKDVSILLYANIVDFNASVLTCCFYFIILYMVYYLLTNRCISSENNIYR